MSRWLRQTTVPLGRGQHGAGSRVRTVRVQQVRLQRAALDPLDDSSFDLAWGAPSQFRRSGDEVARQDVSLAGAPERSWGDEEGTRRLRAPRAP